jgi:pimeloyl-ACP methyl ester carboxylesterase
MSFGALGLSFSGCTTPSNLKIVNAAPDMPVPRLVETNGISMAVYEEGEGIPIIFCHGFPELAYSWRHQLHAVSNSGFHAIAPDLRGYGLTERPNSIDEYTTATICDDLVGMMDAMNIEKAIFCGHDWGGFVADTMPVLYPDRCLGIIGIGAGNNQRPPNIPYPDIEYIELLDKPAFNVYVQQPETVEMLDNNVEQLFTTMFRKDYFTADYLRSLPDEAPEKRIFFEGMMAREGLSSDLILPRDDLDYYIETFNATGFTGGVNWYRAMDKVMDEIDNRNPTWGVRVPYLYIWPDQDPINQLGINIGMEDYIQDLEKRTLTGSGHFVMEDKPEQLSAYIVEWLNEKF